MFGAEESMTTKGWAWSGAVDPYRRSQASWLENTVNLAMSSPRARKWAVASSTRTLVAAFFEEARWRMPVTLEEEYWPPKGTSKIR